MTLMSSSYLLPKFSRGPQKLAKIRVFKVDYFILPLFLVTKSVAKVALRFGCAKQSKNLKRYLLYSEQLK